MKRTLTYLLAAMLLVSGAAAEEIITGLTFLSSPSTGGGGGGGDVFSPTIPCSVANELTLFTNTAGTQLGCTGITWATSLMQLPLDSTIGVASGDLTLKGVDLVAVVPGDSGNGFQVTNTSGTPWFVVPASGGGLKINDNQPAPAAEANLGWIGIDSADGVLKYRKSTADGGALVSLEGSGATALFQQDVFTSIPGQTAFTLSQNYVGVGGYSSVSINTLTYTEGVNYTMSVGTMTWLDTPFTLEAGDTVVVRFQTQ